MTEPNISLFKTTEQDLETLFKFQLQEEGRFLAAFIAKDSNDKNAWISRHTKFLSDPEMDMRTIMLGGEIAGSIASFVIEKDTEITYWIDQRFWGRGIGSAALQQFLQTAQGKPIYGRVAFNNYGSQKVLEKCGFTLIGTDRGFANARGEEIEEFIFRLDK